jgi:2-polyprenyl-3-methyl-5-hydroxy-6-metoxy-1,4-benzoquinol methylase
MKTVKETFGGTRNNTNSQQPENPTMAVPLDAIQQLSAYNAGHDFRYNLQESRLRKCASLIGSLPVGRLLDIGCSRGDWADLWQSRGWQVAGIDVNRDHIAIAQNSGVDARFCDLNRDPLPFDDAQFDLIFAGEVIEHLVDTDGFLNEIYRCCKLGGNLLLTTPNLASFENRIRLLLGIYPKWLNYNFEESGHVRGYTSRALKRQLAVHGFRVLRHVGNWVPFIPQHFIDDIKMPALAITGDLLPGLAMDIIVLARKE